MTNQKDFIDLVREMRCAQIKYFRTHSKQDLADAKKLEQEVDQEIFKQIEKRIDFAQKRLRSLAEASEDIGSPAYLVVGDDN
jgi:hypothetical protein